ncbi:MAG: O-antigen ligase family protein, partial [Gammaproteobacteria bacterium]|nr:O-antigen ligase family protein [Gammaproteobacteria bacterium]
LGLLVLGLALCAVFFTFSRIGYFALGVSGFVLMLVLFRHAETRVGKSLVLVPTLIVGAVALIVALATPYGQSRWATFGEDMTTRISHWEDILSLSADGIASPLLGEGVGTYPRIRLEDTLGTPRQISTYRVAAEPENQFLRLAPGGQVFVLQRLSDRVRGAVTVRMSLRTQRSGGPKARGQLDVGICEKSLLYTIACASEVVPVTDSDWGNVEFTLDTQTLNGLFRPRYLSLFNGGTTVLDIDEIVVQAPSGTDDIANGGFERGFDRWFFNSDDHLHWWTKNLPVLLRFELGWIGLMAFVLVFGFVLLTMSRAAMAGEALSGVILASLLGVATIGLTDGALDVPRNALLFSLLVFAGLQSARQSVRRPRPSVPIDPRDNLLLPMGGGMRAPPSSAPGVTRAR